MRSARDELWQRYDAGSLTSDELDARLLLVDRAGEDPAAITRALEGPVPLRGRRSTRRVLVGGAAGLAVLALAGGAWTLLRDDDGGSGGGGAGPAATIIIGGIPPPIPGGPAPDCPEFEDAIAAFEGIDQDTPAASPALLSDPPALPEGYTVGDEDGIVPGTDPDIAMSVTAGTPPPVEILGRTLTGALSVTMRSFRYDSPEDAAASAELALRTGICSYAMEGFRVPERPEINGSVVSGPIPTTAFAGFRLADRRFSVAVVAAGDGDEAGIEAARLLAGAVATLELDAARTPPG